MPVASRDIRPTARSFIGFRGHPRCGNTVAYRDRPSGMHAVDETDHPASARIDGGGRAWIAALGSPCDYTGLCFTGEKRLAQQILDVLPGRK
jgi:hypothetical protein